MITDELQLALLAELVYEDKLALQELPTFLFEALGGARPDERDGLIARAVKSLAREGLVTVFAVHRNDPDESFADPQLHLAAASLDELLATEGWMDSHAAGSPLWIAATESGRDYLESAPREVKRMLGTLRPGEG